MKKFAAVLLALLMIVSVTSAYADVTLEQAMGSVSGNTYTNNYLKLGVELPAGQGWSYLSESEIMLSNNIGKALLKGDLKDIMEESQNITVMSASASKGTPNLNIQILDMGESAAVIKIVGLEYLLSMQLDDMKAMLENSGMTNVDVSVGQITVKGRTETCLRMSYTFLTMNIYTVQMDFMQDNYAVYVTASASTAAEAEAALNNVFWLN